MAAVTCHNFHEIEARPRGPTAPNHQSCKMSGKAEVPSSPAALRDFLRLRGFQNVVLNCIRGMSTVVCIFYRSNSLGSFNYIGDVLQSTMQRGMARGIYCTPRRICLK